MIRANNHPGVEAAFLRYLDWAVPRRFYDVRVAGAERLANWDPAVPTLVIANHSNWWDGFMAMLVTHRLMDRRFHVMMEERHLRRYRFFTRLGAFGVDRAHPRSARASLVHAAELMAQPSTALWIFPQGRLRPNDVRPLAFETGAARLALRLERVRICPVAMRYEFLHEEKPQALILIGEPYLLSEGAREAGPRALSARMEAEVSALLDELNGAIRQETLDAFLPLVSGPMSFNRRLDAWRVRLGLMDPAEFDPRNGV
ncbi:lysophospholipid acyltransferase family protein [bacterium]|nr:lysophospholipid acyltransferase family protein [bacterium]